MKLMSKNSFSLNHCYLALYFLFSNKIIQYIISNLLCFFIKQLQGPRLQHSQSFSLDQNGTNNCQANGYKGVPYCCLVFKTQLKSMQATKSVNKLHFLYSFCYTENKFLFKMLSGKYVKKLQYFK